MNDHGVRLAHILDYLEMSQTQLAQLVGVSQPVISEATRSVRLNDSLVERVCRATGFGPAFFARDAPLPSVPESAVQFRKLASASERSLSRLRAHLRHAIEVVEYVEGDSRVQLPTYVLSAFCQGVGTPTNFEGLTAGVREAMRVGQNDPIPNMTRAAERAGVMVIGSVVSPEEKHNGASVIPASGRAIVAISSGLSGDRARFTIAHEIGHLTLHDQRSPDRAQAEKEASEFAAALLAPAEPIKEMLEDRLVTLHELVRVKQRFGISIRALISRCLALRLIDVNRSVSLHKQINARGWTREEPVYVEPEAPQVVRRAIEIVGGPRTVSKALGLPRTAWSALIPAAVTSDEVEPKLAPITRLI